MSQTVTETKKKVSKIYKSLYEVKEKYLPNADLEFLEGKDGELSQEVFLKMLKKNKRITQLNTSNNKKPS